MRFGVREICNVVLRAKTTQYLGNKKFYKNEPVLYFDTLKTSTVEGASTTVYATGGPGNSRLVAWEGERTLTFTMEDALISPESFSILSGAGLMDATEKKPIYQHVNDRIQLDEPNMIVIDDIVCWSKYSKTDERYKEYQHNAAEIFIMATQDGEIVGEPCIPINVTIDFVNKKTYIKCYSHAGTIEAGDVVLVDYYVKRVGGAQQIEITADQFGGNYYLEASTLFRREKDGKDMPAEFIIPNCKVQSNFNFSMASTGDPSTFTFTMDAFPDYVKFDETHKVLAAIQVIWDEFGEDDETRKPCVLQEVYSLTEGVDVTFDNDSTETYCKLTATGTNIDGTQYDADWWGDKLSNAAEIEIVMPIEEDGTYRLVTQNPMLKHYPEDASLDNGVWTKDKTYNITDGSLTLRTAVTDDKGAILIKLFHVVDDGEELVKTFSIKNKVNFAKIDKKPDNGGTDIGD